MGISRKTKSLNLLLSEFKDGIKAISTLDLIKRLGKRMNKTTVYRILDKLEEDGILHSFFGKNGVKFFVKCDGCCQTNSSSKTMTVLPHFQCLDCGKLDRLSIKVDLPNFNSSKLNATQVLIQGRCEACV
ncbi:MAG: transcriptional regulator [Flavobacteriaceae bacterium]|nr:transcriptional regulator [Flavobacteriaceae bacterium]MDG2062102.1 transcriptional regulator [Flavobacteriaceae bacterium]|tara:strand:+ start:508 stop:897 length:390 start_codon:yes stop_codon:yes gene_type:complete